MSVKTKYTPSEVIRQVEGLDRKQLYKRMNSNDPEYQISYEPVKKAKRTERVIDVSELIRVFGSRFKPNLQTYSEADGNNQEQDIVSVTTREISDLKEQLRDLEKQLLNEKDKVKLLETNLSDLREDKRFLQKQLESQTNLLEHHQNKKPFWKVF